MRIALVSLDQAWEDKAANRARVAVQIEAAVAAEAKLVVFPEMTLTGYSMAVGRIGEDPMHSETVEFFQGLAHGRIAIAFGVVHIERGKGVNKLMVVGSDGSVLAEYRKLHPFSLAGEDACCVPGDALSSFELGGLRVGCTICYDLRFPAVYQALALHCDVVLNIASWPQQRAEHWDVLLQARAIENQMFMVGVNRCGIDGNGLLYERSSRVYDPSGKTVAPIAGKDPIEIVELDPQAVVLARRSLPFAADRRDAFYAHLYAPTEN